MRRISIQFTDQKEDSESQIEGPSSSDKKTPEIIAYGEVEFKDLP